MMWTLIKLEWQAIAKERASWAIIGFFAVALAAASFLGGRAANQHASGLALAAQQQAERAGQGAVKADALGPHAPLGSGDPRDPAAAGQDWAARLASLPPGPLASVASGQRDVRPSAIRVTTEAQFALASVQQAPMIGPSKVQVGPFDPAFVFVVLFPLVVIALSYDLLSGERERGTLALLLSQPISQTQLVLGKALARASLLAATSVGLALFALMGTGELLRPAPGIGIRIALYLGVLVAYVAFWFSAAVAVNARGLSSATNALILVGLWLSLVIVVPGALRMVVEALHPPPSRVELVNEAREAAQEVESALRALEGNHGTQEEDQANNPGARALEVQEELARRTEPVLSQFRDQLVAQQAWVNRLRFLSPAVLVSEALADVAGTSASRQQYFEWQVERFHAHWRGIIRQKAGSGDRLVGRDYALFPEFAYLEESSGVLAARVGLGALGLLVPALILLLWSAPSFRHIGRLAA